MANLIQQSTGTTAAAGNTPVKYLATQSPMSLSQEMAKTNDRSSDSCQVISPPAQASLGSDDYGVSGIECQLKVDPETDLLLNGDMLTKWRTMPVDVKYVEPWVTIDVLIREVQQLEQQLNEFKSKVFPHPLESAELLLQLLRLCNSSRCGQSEQTVASPTTGSSVKPVSHADSSRADVDADVTQAVVKPTDSQVGGNDVGHVTTPTFLTLAQAVKQWALKQAYSTRWIYSFNSY
jgi:hypothetical protein